MRLRAERPRVLASRYPANTCRPARWSGRTFWPTFGRRRLGRHFQPDLVATQGDTAGCRAGVGRRPGRAPRGVAHSRAGRAAVGMAGWPGVVYSGSSMRPNRHHVAQDLVPAQPGWAQVTQRRRVSPVALGACQAVGARADRRHNRTPITTSHSVITVGPMMVVLDSSSVVPHKR